jgi:hypothetical protein
VSLAGCASAFCVYEGSGHEIWLDGENEKGRALGERLLTEEDDGYGDEREVRPGRYEVPLVLDQIIFKNRDEAAQLPYLHQP